LFVCILCLSILSLCLTDRVLLSQCQLARSKRSFNAKQVLLD
jgi:hypothetical protein